MDLHKVKVKIIVLIVKFLGIFGIPAFVVSSALFNVRQLRFFNSFKQNKNTSLFITENKVIFDLITKRFNHKNLNQKIICLLSDLYQSRIIGVNFKNELLEELILNELKINKLLSIEDWFTLSKLLSRLGSFALAEKIDSQLVSRLFEENDCYTIFNLFQTIKSKLYTEQAYLKTYLDKIGMYKYMNQNFYLSKYLKHNFNNSRNHATILGPLRTSITKDDYVLYDLIIIKPNKSEIKTIIDCNSNKRVYLYTNDFSSNKTEPYDKIIYVKDLKRRFLFFGNERILNNLQFFLINGFPFHLQRTLLHQIFLLDKFKFVIKYFTFYLSDNLVSETYRDSHYKNANNMSNDEKHEFVWTLGWHDLISNFRFTKLLYAKKIIKTCDENTEKILKLSISDYALKMEELYEFK